MQRGRLGSTEEPATSDVMEGGKQEVMVGNGFRLGRQVGPSTGRRCVSVCEQSTRGLSVMFLLISAGAVEPRRSSWKSHATSPLLKVCSYFGDVFFDVKCDTVNYGCMSGEAASSSFQRRRLLSAHCVYFCRLAVCACVHLEVALI